MVNVCNRQKHFLRFETVAKVNTWFVFISVFHLWFIFIMHYIWYNLDNVKCQSRIFMQCWGHMNNKKVRFLIRNSYLSCKVEEGWGANWRYISCRNQCELILWYNVRTTEQNVRELWCLTNRKLITIHIQGIVSLCYIHLINMRILNQTNKQTI